MVSLLLLKLGESHSLAELFSSLETQICSWEVLLFLCLLEMGSSDSIGVKSDCFPEVLYQSRVIEDFLQNLGALLVL